MEMPEEGKNKLSFQNHHKQFPAPFIIYADFESLTTKIQGTELDPNKNNTLETPKHEACSYCYVVVRCDGKTKQPVEYRAPNAAEHFLRAIQEEESEIKEVLSNPESMRMTREDRLAYNRATHCHICSEELMKESFLISFSVYNHETSHYCGNSHKRCYYKALTEINFVGPKTNTKQKDSTDMWIARNQEHCLFCGESLLLKNFKDSVWDH